ncbi:MAG: quinolinate synthase NadA [Nitrospinaceae bacterium]
MPLTAESLHQRLRHYRVGSPLCEFTAEHCARLLPAIQRIQELKREKNAIILAHNYVQPEILYGVADYSGDSYGLSKQARASTADIIVFTAVRFMAETAKILNPEKTVLDPNPDGGCSLADSINAAQVRRLRAEFPGHTFVCYINTTAAVKAECDVCVTSSNVYKILEAIDNDKIYFLPDKLMAQNVIAHLRERGINKEVAFYDGTCYVHEEYEPEAIDFIRRHNQDVEILVHPECAPPVVGKADYVGSTTGMMDHVRQSSGNTFFMLTECGLTGIMQTEFPEKQFVGSCTLCRFMKANSLGHVLQTLEDPRPENVITLTKDVQQRALACVESMFHYAER